MALTHISSKSGKSMRRAAGKIPIWMSLAYNELFIHAQIRASKRHELELFPFFNKMRRILRQLISNTGTLISSQNAVFTPFTFPKEVSSFMLHMAIQHR